MKIIIILVSIFIASVCFADDVTLNQVENLQVPTADKLSVERITINLPGKRMVVSYVWKSGTEQVAIYGNKVQQWVCTNSAESVPPQTCWDDVFLFSIRAQDVGTSIGKGLRNLIWNEMKADILTGGNDGSFAD